MYDVALFKADVVISCTVFWHNAFSTEITENNFNIIHVNKYVTWLRSIDKKISKISDIATITLFPYPPLPPEIPASSHPTIRVRRCQ